MEWVNREGRPLIILGMAELNLSVSVMPSKYNTTVSVRMTDTIAEMKEKLSVSMSPALSS